MASRSDEAALAADTNFQARIKLSVVAAATAVAGEAVGGMSTTHYNKRQALAYTALNNPDTQVTRFAYGVATNATVAGGYGAPIAISSSTAANPAVVTTAAAHGLTTGDCVVIAGHATNTALNGGWTATVLTSTTFSIPVLGTAAGGATGTVRHHPPDSDVDFTVNSLWDDMSGVTALD